MKSVLVLYYSHGGHTARIARRIWETIIAEGHKADLMGIVEADREGVDWNKYDTVIIGCAITGAASNWAMRSPGWITYSWSLEFCSPTSNSPR